MFDAIVLLILLSAAVGGFRLGFVTRALSWFGLAVGLLVGTRVLPSVVDEGGDPAVALLLAVAVLVGGAFLGQLVGLLIGSRLQIAIPPGVASGVDRGAGAAAGAFGVLIALWLLLPMLADAPGWTSREVRASVLAGLVDEYAPAPPDTLQALRRLVGDDRFPQVFASLQPAPDVGPPPAESGLSVEISTQVALSTVRVEGVACRRLQEGSGFVVAPDVVVTNAHVVAGEESTELITRDGRAVEAVVAVFDPDRDLAVLRAPGLGLAPLPVAEADVGATGAVFGYPGGGDLRVAAFAIRQRIEALGRDLYDDHETRRDVYVLAARLQGGDSGSALVDPEGQVVAVAFAIAPDQPDTAYALTTDELNAVLALDRSGQADTGPCL